MAPRTAIPILDCGEGTGFLEGTGVRVDTSNGMSLACAGETSRYFLRIQNTLATEGSVDFAAGSPNPPAFRAGLGAKKLTLPASKTVVVHVGESSRVVQSDGSVNVDFEGTVDGTVWAYHIQRPL
jgi:hypothetical protein